MFRKVLPKPAQQKMLVASCALGASFFASQIARNHFKPKETELKPLYPPVGTPSLR